MFHNVRVVLVGCVFGALLAGGLQAKQLGDCVVVDNGSGTIDLPPMGCGYVSPMQLHEMINGLPAGATINIDASHDRFLCGSPMGPPCEVAGGILGGTIDTFDSTLTLVMQGTGSLSGFSRTIPIPIQCEVHTAPRIPNQPIQAFPTEFVQLQGGIGGGDADFAQLIIVGGLNLVGPSPGNTILTQMGPDWRVDSFFDVAYRIDFVGAPGGALSGFGGSTTGNLIMEAKGPELHPSFCDATDGALASCPCTNPGNPLTGCDIPQATGGVGLSVLAQNTNPNGATLQGSGFSTMGSPTAIVIRSSIPNLPARVTFGDGIRCLDDTNGLVRLASSSAMGGVSTHTFGNGAMAGSGTRHYQLWFRSTPSAFCDALAAFNLSNGRTLIW